MGLFDMPAFGERECIENRANADSRVFILPNADAEAILRYEALLTDSGFAKKEEYSIGDHSFAAYKRGGDGVFLNYFGSVRELTVAAEDNCNYFDRRDTSAAASVSAQITQIRLEDFGMCYVIRLPDGRFIVIDGGRGFEPDVERLFLCLSEGAEGKKPVIASWILSHPHSDHYLAFISFMERYGDLVDVESYLLNFPEGDDILHYPKLAHKDKRFEDASGMTNIPKMWDIIRRSGAPAHMAHTGQRYRFGEASCEILASMDDTLHLSQNINSSSLAIRMELASQVILWSTDASFSDTRLPEKYGEYLKADILQVPHHGFSCGTPEAQIESYKLIRPSVCLMPVSEYNAYTSFSAHRESTRFLMTGMNVEEMIVGDPQRTITLPYTPPETAGAELERKYRNGQARSGATAWVFAGLNTSREEDLSFTVLNMTHTAATLSIDLFFEHSSQAVVGIRASIAPLTLHTLNIIGGEVDGDHEYFDWLSLKKRGVPKDAPFAVRFISDVPVVISHDDHGAVYHSNDI